MIQVALASRYTISGNYKPNSSSLLVTKLTLQCPPKDMNKERNFVLDLLTFIFHRSTANQTSWKEYFKLKLQDKKSPSTYSYSHL